MLIAKTTKPTNASWSQKPHSCNVSLDFNALNLTKGKKSKNQLPCLWYLW